MRRLGFLSHQRPRRRLAVIVIVGVAALTTITAAAALPPPPGSLDVTFDGNGTTLTDFGMSASADAVLAQPDGKIVVVGSGPYYTALSRYRPDGSLDPSFGKGGRVLYGGSSSDQAFAGALAPDGKIVVAGNTDDLPNMRSNLLVGRHLPDGTLDDSFDGDGLRTVDLGDHTTAVDVAVQADGKIVTVADDVGTTTTTSNFLVLRLKPNGHLDTSFGGTGIVETDLGAIDQSWAVAVQPDGKIVVAGHSGNDYAVARYLPNGQLDTSFDGDGMATASVSSLDLGIDVVVQPDGKIVVVGLSDLSIGAVRFTATGALDTTFDGDGKVVVGFGAPSSSGNGVRLQADGKIVIGGSVSTNDSDFAVVRLTTTGALDTTFDGDGKATVDFGSYDVSRGLAIQPSGEIVLAGRSDAAGAYAADFDFAVARFVSGVATCGWKVPTMVGTAVGETLTGTAGDDVIDAGAGSDTVYALGGDDIVCGGPGSDMVFGSTGHDLLIGGVGLDELRGAAGRDVLVGAESADLLIGGDLNDVLLGGDGADELRGGAGNDDLSGDGGNDVLQGDSGTDRLHGGHGTDTCTSGETLTGCP